MACASRMPVAAVKPRCIAITTLDVEFSTPVNPTTSIPGELFRMLVNTGAPSITVDAKRNSTWACLASSRKRAYA